MPSAAQEDVGLYLAELRRRLEGVESDVKRLLLDEHLREEHVEGVHQSLHQEIVELDREMHRVEEDLLFLMERTRALVRAFKDAARTQDYSRFQQRVEAWGGERFISRDELKKALVREFG